MSLVKIQSRNGANEDGMRWWTVSCEHCDWYLVSDSRTQVGGEVHRHRIYHLTKEDL